MRLPPDYTPERGAAAVTVAGRWHSGRFTPLHLFATTRCVRDDEHRGQLRRAVGHLIREVLENPVRTGEFAELTLLRDVIETAPIDAVLGPETDAG